MCCILSAVLVNLLQIFKGKKAEEWRGSIREEGREGKDRFIHSVRVHERPTCISHLYQVQGSTGESG